MVKGLISGITYSLNPVGFEITNYRTTKVSNLIDNNKARNKNKLSSILPNTL